MCCIEIIVSVFCELHLPRLIRWDHIPFKKSVLVSLCEATHCSRAKALQTLLEAAAVSWEGLRSV